MAKIQARNVDDALYQRIEQSAMKNERSLEGEIRTALREYYQPVVSEEPMMSERERWQRETGKRLRWLFDRLIEDNYYRTSGRANKAGVPELVQLARQLDTSPGLLMDIMEGNEELPFSLADAIAEKFGSSAEWLLGNSGSPFIVTRIGSSGYTQFLLPGNVGNYTFELIRISTGRHAGTLIILRTDEDSGHTELAVITEAFYLCAGMGTGGHSNLKRFLLFLKTKSAHFGVNTFDFEPEEPDFHFWSVIGHHHPVWFQDANRRSTARWLQQIFIGDDPADWFKGWETDLKEISNTPFGEDSSNAGGLASE
jgi:hypothetical protein